MPDVKIVTNFYDRASKWCGRFGFLGKLLRFNFYRERLYYFDVGAERYEMRDILDHFFRCRFNNIVFVYQK